MSLQCSWVVTRWANARRWVIGWSCAVAALWAEGAAACTVCYGDSEAAIVRGAEQATLLMVGVTYLLLGGGAATFVVLRQRARRSAAGAVERSGGEAGLEFSEGASSQGASK